MIDDRELQHDFDAANDRHARDSPSLKTPPEFNAR
jgi:hypothetical protein